MSLTTKRFQEQNILTARSMTLQCSSVPGWDALRCLIWSSIIKGMPNVVVKLKYICWNTRNRDCAYYKLKGIIIQKRQSLFSVIVINIKHKYITTHSTINFKFYFAFHRKLSICRKYLPVVWTILRIYKSWCGD